MGPTHLGNHGVVPGLAVSAGEVLRWAAANWIGIFSMFAMLAFVVLLVVMAMVPDKPPEDRGSGHPGTATEKGNRESNPQRS